MQDRVTLLQRLYEKFNQRKLEEVLEALDQDVLWANGMDGGHVHGRDGVRSYWTRQWLVVDPRVEPTAFNYDPDRGVLVDVHQTILDLSGNVILDRMVRHIFQIENGLVLRFDIDEG
jgi:arylsulfatase A-like enzyme